jgi:hypothetical protein
MLFVTSVNDVVPVKILLLPVENTILVPSLLVNSNTLSTPALDPRGVVELVSFFIPCLAPILPNLSMTAFSAMDAKDESWLTGES